MSEDELRYDRLVETALRSVVRDALKAAVPDAMPGDHHFYLTFRTRAPGVSIPDFLLEQYPEEMTIVLQHQFWNLSVDEERFAVTLSFNNRPADLSIPFAALTAFIDPSVKFGLQFNPEDGAASGGDVQAANSGGASSGAVPMVAETGEGKPPAPIDGPITAPSDEAEARAAHEKAKAEADKDAGEGESDGDDAASAEVVSLDSFRKK